MLGGNAGCIVGSEQDAVFLAGEIVLCMENKAKQNKVLTASQFIHLFVYLK